MFKFPFLTLIYIVSFLLGIALIVWLIIRLWNARHKEEVKRLPLAWSIIGFLIALLLITFSTAVFWFSMSLQSYRAFNKKELTAIVVCDVIAEGEKGFKLTFVEISDGKKSEPREFLIMGDQWAIESHILKWDGWVNMLGIHTFYKLIRISGRYVDIEDELSRERSAYEVDKSNRWLWRVLYQKGQKIPFVDSVYGSSTFTYPIENIVFGVYVTTSGLMIQEITNDGLYSTETNNL